MSVTHHTAGKISLATILSIVAVFVLVVLLDIQNGGHVSSVQATSTATTTVTVLNTPPDWSMTARELWASATSTPTDVGSTTVWVATAHDNNDEPYWLLICMSSSSVPTRPLNVGPAWDTTPECGGGPGDQWAVSALTPSDQIATATAATPWALEESNDWFGYICDNNGDGFEFNSPRCNLAQYNGQHETGPWSATSSPFMVNHPPYITSAADGAAVEPGGIASWTTVAGDQDSLGGDDTIQIHVCKSQGFATSVPSCIGEQWATSTFVTDNPGTSTEVAIPTQDGNLDAYVYLVDQHGLTATSTWHGGNTQLTIANAYPYIASTSINLYDVFGSTTPDDDMNLTEPEGETQNFVVTFDVTDVNGCQNTALGNEITDVDINVFRSDIGDVIGDGCDSALEYDANNCYTDRHSQWVPVCQQVAASCTPADWNNISWECTFPLWYIADATDDFSENPGSDWRASARATDDNASTSVYSTDNKVANTGAEMQMFLSFRATGTPIAYGAWEPGQGNAQHPATTTVYATGNTGLNHYLSGDPMCVTYTTDGLGCTGNATSTIYVPYQHYSTTSQSYAYGFDLGNSTYQLATSTVPVLVNVDIEKTDATNTPMFDDTYWGIKVPDSITFAGDYIGQNYIDAVVAPSGEW